MVAQAVGLSPQLSQPDTKRRLVLASARSARAFLLLGEQRVDLTLSSVVRLPSGSAGLVLARRTNMRNCLFRDRPVAEVALLRFDQADPVRTAPPPRPFGLRGVILPPANRAQLVLAELIQRSMPAAWACLSRRHDPSMPDPPTTGRPTHSTAASGAAIVSGLVRSADDEQRGATLCSVTENRPSSTQPIAEVLAGLRVPALPSGTTARNAFVLVQVDEADGSLGWCVRVTSGLDNDELLGVLTGYQEHLKQQAAASWDDGDPTRAVD